MKLREFVTKLKLFSVGLAVGAGVAFPLGMNFAREAPLLSNPLDHVDLEEQVAERVKRGTETVLEGARVKIHEATQPTPVVGAVPGADAVDGS